MTKEIQPRAIGPKKPDKKRQGLQALHGAASMKTPSDVAMFKASQGIQKILTSSSEAYILEALALPTDIDVLVYLMSDSTAMGRALQLQDDPLRAARARALKKRVALLKEEGGTLGGAEVADRIRMTRGGVDARRKAGKLLAVEGGSRTVAYPAWQFSDDGVLKGFEEVLAAFYITDPLMRISFFLTKNPDLDERPLDALRQGKVEAVRDAASRFGRFGDDG